MLKEGDNLTVYEVESDCITFADDSGGLWTFQRGGREEDADVSSD